MDVPDMLVVLVIYGIVDRDIVRLLGVRSCGR